MSEKKQFTEWLNKKLRELNTDENVFGEYIISILEDAETADERQDGLEGILSEMIVSTNSLKTIMINHAVTENMQVNSIFIHCFKSNGLVTLTCDFYRAVIENCDT